jgi:hypothetical protein
MGNYDPSMKEFADNFIALAPKDLELAGIYADKPGYHNKRSQLPADDYSVREFEIDRQGPSTNASAVDITSKSATGGDYTIINKYSKRLLAAGQANDPRTHGWREFFGQTDGDNGVEGWDFAKKQSSTSADKSHLWHIHISEHRGYTTSKDNKAALLSILKGESLQTYLDNGGKLVGDATPTPPKPSDGKLVVDGKLGPATISLWQKIMGTTVDGVISDGPGGSELVKAVQRHLASSLHRSLRIDGFGIKQDGRQYETTAMLQRYLGTPVDYRLSVPVSTAVKALQTRLNTGRF